MEKCRIAVVGAGGIGSYLCKELHNFSKYGQFGAYDVEIVVWDDDTVDTKNLKYQNYEEFDLGDDKSEVLGLRYNFDYEVERLEDAVFLDGYNVVIAAVDNSPFRELLYNWAEKNPEAYWIDLRSEGRSVAFFTKHKDNTLEKMLDTLAETPEGGTSCQLAHELEKGIIQQGNKIIASIGSQLFLNYLRKEHNSAQFIARF
jgi:molybdopterin/thiamine biosynthesis adenylyltransferase